MLTLSISSFLAFFSSAVFVVGYISSNNLFPEPLSAEEEKMYLEKMRSRGWRGTKYINRKKLKISSTCL